MTYNPTPENEKIRALLLNELLDARDAYLGATRALDNHVYGGLRGRDLHSLPGTREAPGAIRSPLAAAYPFADRGPSSWPGGCEWRTVVGERTVHVFDHYATGPSCRALCGLVLYPSAPIEESPIPAGCPRCIQLSGREPGTRCQ